MLDSLTDCGGGDGTTARSIIKAYPHIKCTVLDLPKVIDKAPADGVINYVAGDLFHSIPPSQAVMLKVDIETIQHRRLIFCFRNHKLNFFGA